eukprot:gene1175-1284_t
MTTTEQAVAVKPELIWSLDDVKAMIHEERLWPSFLGNRVALEAQYSKEEKADLFDKAAASNLTGSALVWTLPAVLWPEQQRHRARQQLQGTEEQSITSSRTRKRKLSESEEEEEDGHSQKRSRPSAFLETVYSLSRRVWHFISGGFFSPAPPSSSAKTKITREVVEEERKEDAVLPSSSLSFRDKVFEILHNHPRYILGNGDVYGGDYTIYKDGDPSTTHSAATVRLHGRSTIAAKEILAFSRVQNQVAKAAVLAFAKPASTSTRNDTNTLEGNKVGFLVFNFRGVASR